MVKEKTTKLSDLVNAGRWPEVKRATKALLTNSPKDLDTLRARAQAYCMTGDTAKAEKLLKRALLFHPDSAQAHLDLGVLLARDERLPEARLAFVKAVQLDDRNPDTYCHLATVLKRQGDYASAENILRSCIKTGIKTKHTLMLLSEVLLRREKIQESQELMSVILSENSTDWRVWTNLGYACSEVGDNESATVFLAKAFELKPDSVEVMVNYGTVLNRFGSPGYAKQVLNIAASLQPENPSPCWNRSFANFNLGRWDEAWSDYQFGFQAGQRTPYRRFDVPEWTGEPLEDQRLMVWCEQGLGDKLQDGFYIKRLLEQYKNVIIETEERLLGLFTQSFPEATVRVARRFLRADGIEAATDFDLHIPASNVRQLFGGPEFADTVTPAYISTDSKRRARWRRFYNTSYPDVLRVGLAWRSSRIAPFGNCTQNLDLSAWASVLQTPGVQFFSLAYYDDAEEVAAAEAATGVCIHRFTDIDMRNDLDEVMALSAELDLTIGTAITPTDIAHVSGCETWWVFPSTARAQHVQLGRGLGQQRFFINRVQDQEDPANTLQSVAGALDERATLMRRSLAS